MFSSEQMVKQEARDFLKRSIHGRAETIAVLSAVLDLGVISNSDPCYAEAVRLSSGFIRNGGHQMNTSFRAVDRLAVKDVEAFSEFFPHLAGTALTRFDATDDRSYVEAVKEAVRGGLDSLGAPSEVSAGEALSSLNRANFSIPDGWSKNRWKKAVRFLSRVEEFCSRMAGNIDDREATIVGKSRLSAWVDVDSLDDETLSAIAYLVARANRRSVFGMFDQSKAFDTVHEALVGKLTERSNWFELSKVYPTGVAFKHLGDSEKAELLSVFFNRMVQYGARLGELYRELPVYTQENLITAQGTDSSRWNIYSGAYNTMRSAWVNLTTFLDMGKVFESFLPGKAPRIMAADIVRMREWDGQDLHSDQALFFKFPKPWEIISGDAALEVEEARKFDGWAAPLKDIKTETPSIEPTLVNGVVVGSPLLAELLKKSGVFAGAKSRKL